MITRRDFIKGLGALALIPFIPEMVKPERKVLTADAIIHRGIAYWTTREADGRTMVHREPLWDNTGEATIPHDGTRYKVRYTVNEDGTEITGVE